MLNAHLLCLPGDREITLTRLRDLGVIHVAAESTAETADRAELAQRLARIERAVGFLAGIKAAAAEGSPTACPVPAARGAGACRQGTAPTGQAVAEQVMAAMDRLADLDKENESLQRDRDRLLPWGDFAPQRLRELRDAGIHVALCLGSEDDLARIPNSAMIQVVHRLKDRVWFAVVSPEPLEELSLPLAPVTTDLRLADVEARLGEMRQSRENINAKLAALRPALTQLRDHRDEVAHEVEFLRCRDAMAKHGPVLALAGYVPVPDADALRAASRTHGWGLLLQEPGPDEPVPTLLHIPKPFRIIEPVMKFLGIMPGYDEVDVSVCFLFFFTIFFGMIVGDAGYGTLFLLLAIVGKFLDQAGKHRVALNLAFVLSGVTILWGSLSGNWFGVDWGGIQALTDPAVKNANIQLLCFILGVAHLTIGHAWQALLSGKARPVLGHLGWTLVLWGNFFLTYRLLVAPGPFPVFMYWLYGVGIALALACGVNWRDIGDIFNFPFGVIGSFSDLLSYIRLFAVGMAGYYIAMSFNNMGVDLMGWRALPMPLAVLAGATVILAGHGLNIVLCLMGVLVHGVRLNALEFSNHMGLRWSGFSYQPFSKETRQPTGGKP
jgi:V/A-type H+-transporting ATPase subunit I